MSHACVATMQGRDKNALALTETIEPSVGTQAPASARGPATEEGGGKADEARDPAPQDRKPDRADRRRQAGRKIASRRSARGHSPQEPSAPHPITVAIGVILLAAAAAGGYIYWDYARHFESTDDAFIAARQFAVAPKVSGYITAVPVTDNQHVAAGNVIARIDDRDYRIALEQAQAQVAAAKANIQNIDAQIDGAAGADQREPGAGGAGAGGADVRASSRRRATRTWPQSEARHGAEGPADGSRRFARTRRRSRMRKRPSRSPSARSTRSRRSAAAPRRASRKPTPSATRRNSTCPTRP